MIVLGFAGFSGSGKTTLLTRLIPVLRQRGLRVAVIKHTHHNFDPDIPGKDSHRVREAGAVQVLAASNRRWALFTELPEPQEPELETLLAQLDPARCDLVLVEGMRHGAHPKIEVHRPSLKHPLLALEDPWIQAVASDAPLDCPYPYLDLNDPDSVVTFILAFYKSSQAQS